MKRFLIIFLAAGLILFAGLTSAYATDSRGESTLDTDAVAIGIAVMTQPTRTEYSAFDVFEPAGLTVRVDYSDDEYEIVSGESLGIEYLTNSECLRFGDGGVYISYEDMRLLLPLEVKKREYDLSGITLSPLTCIYSGNWQRIELSHEMPIGLDGLPLKASVQGAGCDVGVYNVSLTFSTDSRDYAVPEPQNARLEILPFSLKVEWDTTEFTYDGMPKIPRAYAIDERGECIELLVQGEGLYASESYIAHAIAPSDNYTLSGALTPYRIKRADYDVSNVCWVYSDFVYDGAEKSVSLLGLPDGITLLGYKGNSASGAGVYRAEAILSYDVRNYNPPMIPALDWKIAKATYDLDDVRWIGLDVTYDGEEHRAELVGLPDGIKILEYIGGAATSAGSYPVRAVFEFDEVNYNPPTIPEATLNIAKKIVPIPASTTVIYDGENHEINYSAKEYYQNSALSVKSIGRHTVTLMLRDPANYAFSDGGAVARVQVVCRLSDSARVTAISVSALVLFLIALAVFVVTARRERLRLIFAALRCRTTPSQEHFLPLAADKERQVLLPETALLSVDAGHADTLISDSLAKTLIATEPEPIYTDGRRKRIVNVDVLSSHFEPGERIDVNILKERGLVPVDTAYIKILASGVIDKPLVVLANDFSLAAVKMIALTGGEARRVITIRKKEDKKE